jgi:uncharacterized surface protein with fasciclin (FAS1) repeats
MRKIMTAFEMRIAPLMLLGILFLTVTGCKKVSVVERTTQDVNIAGYIQEHPETFSEFQKIMERSDSKGFLQAYGAYTIFVPTNDAIKKYLADQKLTSVDQIEASKLRDLVFLHLIEDSIKTTDFTDGKLRNVTMFGQYLVTGAVNTDGVSKITINRQANLVEGNIRTGNGIIHVIDNVLTPEPRTVAQILDEDPKYSIFVRALKETGLFNRLNIRPKENTVVAEKHLTVFAETNEALAAAGYDTYEKLLARYSKTGNPANTNDSLYLYIAYHIAPQARYYAELTTSTSISTFAVPTISVTTGTNEQILINEFLIGDQLEPGAPINRSASDITASNGVVHSVTGHYAIKKRVPQAVYYDVADQPEFRRLAAWKTSTYRHQSTNPPLSRIKFSKYWIEYVGNWAGAAGKDVMRLPTGNPSRSPFHDITTPFIAAGKYKLWICYPKAGRGGAMTFYLNGKKLPRKVDLFALSGANSLSEDQREQAGWKQYVMPLDQSLDKFMARSMGIVEITTDGPQVIRMEIDAGSFNDAYYLDMIHFIPDGQNQLWPRFDETGQAVPKP